MKTASVSRQQWVTKHVSGFCGTGKMMHRWKKRESAKCPRCDQDEDAEHVWICQGSGANEVWDQSISNLREWLKEQKTNPILTEALCTGLSAWRYTRPSDRDRMSAPIQGLMEDQDRIGWKALLEGTPMRGWREQQQAFLTSKGSRRTGLRWVIALIQKLWDVAWDQWQHRNGILHDKDSEVLQAVTNRQIKEQIELGSTTLTQEGKALFRTSIRKIWTFPDAMKKGWLVRIEASRKRFQARKEAQEATYSRERGTMAEWLGRATISGLR